MGIDARLWARNLSDGEDFLFDIAEHSGMPFTAIHESAKLLRANGMFKGNDRFLSSVV
jgi:aminopeptidase-like protein